MSPTSSGLLLVGWCVAVWTLAITGDASRAALVVFGVTGALFALILFLARVADPQRRVVVAFIAAVVLGPFAGWLIGSQAAIALGPTDAIPRLAVRVLLGGGVPAIALCALVVRTRPGAPAVLAAVALVGLAALSCRPPVRDLTRGVLEREVVVTGVNLEEGGWVAYFRNDVGAEIDPDRHDIVVGDRGHATILVGSRLLLGFELVERTAPTAVGHTSSVRGEGLGRMASILGLVLTEALFCAGLFVTRARRAALPAIMLPLLVFPQFLVLTVLGEPVEAAIIDKAVRSAQGRSAKWSHFYFVRARTGDGRAASDTTDEQTYRRITVGDRVRFVVGPANTRALGEPSFGVERLAVFVVAAALTIALTRRPSMRE